MKISSRVLSVAMGVAMVSGLALVGATPARAVTADAKASFIAGIVTPAQKAQRQFGVPASVSIAQAIVASDWGTSAQVKQAKNYFDTPCSASMTAAQFAKLAEAQVGKPYVLGAETLVTQADPAKFDCSELVQWLFGRSGNPITDLAAAQYNATKKVASGTSPRTGDLVFLRNNPARSNGIGHVAVLTKKLSSGDWEIIEARGRAYGVVKTTLSYWKQRSYYAGLRRYSKLVFANTDGVEASAAAAYQSGCVTISSRRYAKFGSVTDSFAGHAAAVVDDSDYKAARGVINNIPAYVNALAKVEEPKDAAAYAKTINGLIASYKLTDYDVVPFDLVLLSGNKGTKVSALQYLLHANGSSVKATGTYDSATVSAVKKFQAAKKLDKDGEAGPNTLTALFATVSTGATGDRVKALNALLAAVGQATTAGATFGKETLTSLKRIQSWAGRSATGVADANTWTVLFMTPDNAPAPVLSGTPQVTQTLTASVGKWSPGSFTLAYQWYRSGAPIPGAIASTYTLRPEDAGAAVTVTVSGTRPGYTTVARVATPTAAIAKAKLSATPVPKITGKLAVGQSLTAVPGTWSPGPVPLTYQWYRGTTAIPGAKAATYAVQAADLGAKVKVVVTAAKPGYEAIAKMSDATAAVAKGTLSDTPTPKVTGYRNRRQDPDRRCRHLGTCPGRPDLPVVPRQDRHQGGHREHLRAAGRRCHGDDPRGRHRGEGRLRHRRQDLGCDRCRDRARPDHRRQAEDHRHSKGGQDRQGEPRFLGPGRGQAQLSLVPRGPGHQGSHEEHLQAEGGRQGPHRQRQDHRQQDRLRLGDGQDQHQGQVGRSADPVALRALRDDAVGDQGAVLRPVLEEHCATADPVLAAGGHQMGRRALVGMHKGPRDELAVLAEVAGDAGNVSPVGDEHDGEVDGVVEVVLVVCQRHGRLATHHCAGADESLRDEVALEEGEPPGRLDHGGCRGSSRK